MTAYTKNKTIGDLIRWEVETLGMFTRVGAPIKNTLGSSVTLSNPVGTPLKLVSGVYELLAAGEESLCAGILLEAKAIPAIANAATSPKSYLILKRGPAVIDRAKLATADGVAASFTMADLYAALEANNIACHAEPPRHVASDA